MATDTTNETVGQEPPPTASEIHRYATWVHLGPGAEDCEALARNDAGEVASATGCADRAHFHAWCRLPNQVQHEDLHTKGMAAKARRIRVLRDETSDEAVVLDADLDTLRTAGDEAKPAVVDEILGKTFWQRYVEASRDVREQTDEDGETPVYEHIDDDQARFNDLHGIPEAERGGDQAEYEELVKHLAAYAEAVQQRLAALERPEREALTDRPLEDLLRMVRDDRVQKDAERVFMKTYSRWEWLVCTLDSHDGSRRFRDMDALAGAAPEVLDALEQTFNDLEQTRNRDAQRGALGNA